MTVVRIGYAKLIAQNESELGAMLKAIAEGVHQTYRIVSSGGAVEHCTGVWLDEYGILALSERPHVQQYHGHNPVEASDKLFHLFPCPRENTWPPVKIYSTNISRTTPQRYSQRRMFSVSGYLSARTRKIRKNN